MNMGVQYLSTWTLRDARRVSVYKWGPWVETAFPGRGLWWDMFRQAPWNVPEGWTPWDHDHHVVYQALDRLISRFGARANLYEVLAHFYLSPVAEDTERREHKIDSAEVAASSCTNEDADTHGGDSQSGEVPEGDSGIGPSERSDAGGEETMPNSPSTGGHSAGEDSDSESLPEGNPQDPGSVDGEQASQSQSGGCGANASGRAEAVENRDEPGETERPGDPDVAGSPEFEDATPVDPAGVDGDGAHLSKNSGESGSQDAAGSEDDGAPSSSSSPGSPPHWGGFYLPSRPRRKDDQALLRAAKKGTAAPDRCYCRGG